MKIRAKYMPGFLAAWEKRKRLKSQSQLTTTQLQSEDVHKKQFVDYCQRNSLEIVHEFSSWENKNQNTDADFLVKGLEPVIVAVSLKTKNGTMCLKNTGTQLSFAKKWLVDEKDLGLVKAQSARCLAFRQTVKDMKYAEHPNGDEIKSSLITPWLDTYYEIFQNKDNIWRFFNYYNDGKSPYMFHADELIKTDTYQIKDSDVKIISKRTLYICGLKWRFKSAGGQCSSSIKGVICE